MVDAETTRHSFFENTKKDPYLSLWRTKFTDKEKSVQTDRTKIISLIMDEKVTLKLSLFKRGGQSWKFQLFFETEFAV